MSSWTMLRRLAALDCSGVMPVSRHQRATNTLPYQTPAMSMPTTIAGTTDNQLISMALPDSAHLI